MENQAGYVLKADLSSGKTTLAAARQDLAALLFAGRGLAMAYLYDELTPGVDPLSAENKLVMAAGPLAATGIQGVSRWVVMTKSPLTGLAARSVAGGMFAAYLRFAGIELLMIEGRASVPSYLYISRDLVEVRPCQDLWGLSTGKTEEKLKERYGKTAQVAAIGPAGENLVKYAAIIHHKRAAARCGVGTVMGSKNLKAVVLDVAPRRLPLARQELFQRALTEQINQLKEHPRRKNLSREGTTALTEMAVQLGMFPVRNFLSGKLEQVERLYADSFQKYRMQNKGCYHCLTKCGQIHRVTGGVFAGTESEGPEYETIWAFGGQVGNTDPEAVIAFDHLCDQLGLDTISTGNVLGFTCELVEQGILAKENLEGLDIGWGKTAGLLALVEKIANGKGIGQLLGQGVKGAAAAIGNGAEEIAMHVKGLELPAYDPRSIKGYGLSYATSNIGGSHMYGRPRPEIYGGANSGFAWAEEGKGEMVARVQMRQAFDEVLISCCFGLSGVEDALLSRLILGATGWEELADVSRWEQIGERIITLERMFNLRESLTQMEDKLPARFYRQPLAEAGLATGQVIHSLDKMLAEYYHFLGYNNQGVPTFARLHRLGLDQLIQGGERC
jgi:aldehyde:ferredoxin oxidoreductase